MVDWHCLFGLVLFVFFTGSDYVVEVEKDLSFKKQMLDVVIVLRDLPQEEQNVPLHLFSAVPDQIKYGSQHFIPHNLETSTLIFDLFRFYKQEGITMSYTLEDYRREKRQEFMAEMTPEELAELPAQKLKKLVGILLVEKRLEGLSAEDILKTLLPEQIKAYLKKLKGDSPESGQ